MARICSHLGGKTAVVGRLRRPPQLIISGFEGGGGNAGTATTVATPRGGGPAACGATTQGRRGPAAMGGSSPCAAPVSSLGFAIAVAAAAAARGGDGARGTDFYWAQLPSRTSFASGGRRRGCLLPFCRHGSTGRHMSMMVELLGSPVAVNYFLVCTFSGESPA